MWVRARSLVSHWEEGVFTIRNYVTNGQVEVGIGIVGLLDAIQEPVTWSELLAKAASIPFAAKVLRLLKQETIILEVGTSAERKDSGIDRNWKWGHDARQLHFGTQHVEFNFDLAEVRKVFERKALTDPPPSPFLEVAGEHFPLPDPKDEFKKAEFWHVLNSRRSCRDFAPDSLIRIEHLSALLKAAFGFQRYFNESVLDQRIIKTSPSGGARHPLEAFLIVRSVAGVKAGVYHYRCAAHELVKFGRRPPRKRMIRLFGGQAWMADASAVVVFTAVVARSMWKYDHSRAYRVVTLDAGHLGQTFQLVGTALGMGVFNTAAFDDTGLEQLLGIDGVNQIVVYAGAFGGIHSSK